LAFVRRTVLLPVSTAGSKSSLAVLFSYSKHRLSTTTLTRSSFKQLKDPKEAAEYLNACMSDSEEVFLLALRDVVEASGGMANLARKTSLNRENLYRSLSKKGNPKLSSLASILEAVGIKLFFAPTKKQKKAA
jgi:probable addiction module antidote protein